MGGRRYLVTGGAGFIGSNFVLGLLAAEPNATVINLDLLTYAGTQQTVSELDRLGRHQLVHGDIRDSSLVESLMPDIDVVVNFAAESHVDRSITDPNEFLSTNVVGTGVLLEAAYRNGIDRFIQVSTDEVYGSIDEGVASEASPLNPSSPYAASKAAADLIVAAYRQTYGYEAIVTRCTNNYGPYQHPEKLIPLAITRQLGGLPVPLYGDGSQQRDWLWVEDHCAAIRMLVDEGEPGETYNVSADRPWANIDLVAKLSNLTGVDTKAIEFVANRLGHDQRYALDSSKLRALGWSPRMSLDEGLTTTVDWYRDHQEWWRPLVGKL